MHVFMSGAPWCGLLTQLLQCFPKLTGKGEPRESRGSHLVSSQACPLLLLFERELATTMLLWELLCRVSALLRGFTCAQTVCTCLFPKEPECKILHKCNQQTVCSIHAQEECYSTFPHYCNRVQKADVDF